MVIFLIIATISNHNLLVTFRVCFQWWEPSIIHHFSLQINLEFTKNKMYDIFLKFTDTPLGVKPSDDHLIAPKATLE